MSLKLCVFDFDSTLMDGETIDEIAGTVGKKKEIEELTNSAMQGEMDFFDSLTKRAEILKGVKYDDVIKICESLPPMEGAFDLIEELKKMGSKVIIFSGGFREGTSFLGKKLGVDCDFANRFQVKDGVLTGKVGGDMMFGYSKGDMIQRMQQLLGVSKEETLACGDGANDASMFPYAEKKVAFCGKPVLREQANIKIDKKDLREILNHI